MSRILSSGIVDLVFGCVFALFHKRLASSAVRFWFKRSSPRLKLITEKIYRFGFLVGGLFLAVLGLLRILGLR